MTENKKSTFGREHIYFRTCHLDYMLPPDTGGIHHNIAFDTSEFACMMIAEHDTADTVARTDKIDDLMIGKNVGAVLTCGKSVCRSQPERIDRSVWHLDGTYDVGIDRRLHTDSLGRIYDLGVDTGLQA